MKIRSEDACYLNAYFDRSESIDAAITPWKSKVCQECGEICPVLLDGGPGQNTIEHMSKPEVRRAREAFMRWTDQHITDFDTGTVLIACEGYHQINPNMLGMENLQWMDWIEELGAAEDEVRHERFKEITREDVERALEELSQEDEDGESREDPWPD